MLYIVEAKKGCKKKSLNILSLVAYLLKSLLHQGLSEPEFYGDLVCKFKKIRGMTDFSDQFRKVIMCYKRIGYNLNVMRQSVCLVINPITVNGFAALVNCTPLDRASDIVSVESSSLLLHSYLT